MKCTANLQAYPSNDKRPFAGTNGLSARRLSRRPGPARVRAMIAIIGILLGCAALQALPPDSPPPPPNIPPNIEDFAVTRGPSEWIFEGRVVDEDPLGLVITFGGLLNGHQAIVNDGEGYFYYGAPVSGPGTVSAHTVDGNQQGSNYAYCNIP